MSQQHAPGPLTVAVSADNNNAHTVTSAALASDMGNGDARFDETLAYIAARLPAGWQPTMAVICGSGLGGLVDAVTAVEKDGERVELDYADVPHFAQSTVHGHAGKLVFGLLSGVRCVCMVGRFHFYEGHALRATTYPVRVFSLLGVKLLLVTNAAGSLNHRDFQPGNVMVISDHINVLGMAGQNPLVGPNLERFGPRFPATSDAYSRPLRQLALDVGRSLGLGEKVMREGVYSFVAGPSYETKAEARMLRMVGADAVGMSTVPEVIVARHCSIEVLGLSLITNFVVMSEDDGVEKATHEDVLKTSQLRAKEMVSLVKLIAERLPSNFRQE